MIPQVLGSIENRHRNVLVALQRNGDPKQWCIIMRLERKSHANKLAYHFLILEPQAVLFVVNYPSTLQQRLCSPERAATHPKQESTSRRPGVVEPCVGV